VHLAAATVVVTAGVAGVVPLSGAGLNEGREAFFVRLADASGAGGTCDAAAACYASGLCPWQTSSGGYVTHGELAVTLDSPGVYALCYALLPGALLPSEFALVDVRLQVAPPPSCRGKQSWVAKCEPVPGWLTPRQMVAALEEATHADEVVIEEIPHSSHGHEVAVDVDVCDDSLFSQSHKLEHAQQASLSRPEIATRLTQDLPRNRLFAAPRK